MKGDKTIIAHLNVALRNELTAINQYFLHSRMFRDWGLNKLAEHEYNESVDEMKHADQLIERILLLEGLPNVQDIGKIMIGENVHEALNCDLKLEQIAIPDLRAGIADAETAKDLCEPGFACRHPRIGGRTRRLAGNPARPDREDRSAKLHSGPDVAGLKVSHRPGFLIGQ